MRWRWSELQNLNLNLNLNNLDASNHQSNSAHPACLVQTWSRTLRVLKAVQIDKDSRIQQNIQEIQKIQKFLGKLKRKIKPQSSKKNTKTNRKMSIIFGGFWGKV